MTNRGEKFVVHSCVPGVHTMTVVFAGLQETGFDELPAFSLYNLIEDLPAHPKDSTLSRNTLERYGYVFPIYAP